MPHLRARLPRPEHLARRLQTSRCEPCKRHIAAGEAARLGQPIAFDARGELSELLMEAHLLVKHAHRVANDDDASAINLRFEG